MVRRYVPTRRQNAEDYRLALSVSLQETVDGWSDLPERPKPVIRPSDTMAVMVTWDATEQEREHVDASFFPSKTVFLQRFEHDGLFRNEARRLFSSSV